MAPAPRPDQLNDHRYVSREYVEKRRSTENIGRELGCTGQAVALALRRHSIPVRNGGGRPMSPDVLEKLSDSDWLRCAYQVLNSREIAEKLGVSGSLVRRQVRELHVDPDHRWQRKHRRRAARKWHADAQRESIQRQQHRRQQAERARRRKRERTMLRIAIAAVVLAAEQERIDGEEKRIARDAEPLAELMRAWKPNHGTPPLVQFRVLLQEARATGAEFDVAWHAAVTVTRKELGGGSDYYNGHLTAVRETRETWRQCYERVGKPMALNARILDD